MNKKIEKAKQHVVDHKAIYVTAAIAFAAGAVTVLVFKKGDIITQTVSGKSNVVIGKAKNVEVIVNYLSVRGYVAKAVRCLETGEEFASQIEGAEAFGETAANFSKHMNGMRDTVKGFHFEYVPQL